MGLDDPESDEWREKLRQTTISDVRDAIFGPNIKASTIRWLIQELAGAANLAGEALERRLIEFSEKKFDRDTE